MPDSVFPTFQKIHRTPLRDLLRGRLSSRLDWKSHVASAGLPESAADLIIRVLKRTRLFRLEKAAVADELIAHFLDGLDGEKDPAQLIQKFGDERVAARLIRRAKRRGRAWPWRMSSAAIRCAAILVGIYAILFIRFCLGRPAPSVDYLARINQPILQTVQSDRAWPLWRRAILTCSDQTADGPLRFPNAIFSGDQEKAPWPRIIEWLDAHASALEIARQAGKKPELGFVLGPGGSQEDPEMRFSKGGDVAGEPLAFVLLPHVGYLRNMAEALSLDAKLSAERSEGARAESDLLTMIALGRQLRESDGFLITQLVALAVDRQVLIRLRFILFHDPDLLKDEALIRLAHALSRPRVAADLMSLDNERYFFADLVQRIYTDNGHGDGRITLNGLKSAAMLMDVLFGRSSIDWTTLAATSTFPVLSASRADLLAKYDQFMDQTEANFHKPLREIDVHQVQSEINQIRSAPIERLRFLLLAAVIPNLTAAQAHAERYLGERDGAITGIGLELYRRRNGKYPSSLSELVPQFLPEIPADRITGEPVKYKLIDGKPVVYSVGANRIDDRGRPPDPKELRGIFRDDGAAVWGVDPREAPRGDWVLFAPDAPDADQ